MDEKKMEELIEKAGDGESWREVIEMAYQQGKEDGVKEFVSEVWREVTDIAYEQGREDAINECVITIVDSCTDDTPLLDVCNILYKLKEQKNDQAEPNP